MHTQHHLQHHHPSHTSIQSVLSLPPLQDGVTSHLSVWNQREALTGTSQLSSDKPKRPTVLHCLFTQLAALTDIPATPLIKMRKGLQSGPAHTGHQYRGEENEREVWREKEQQHRRAEKKLLAFWMSLSHRTWTFFRPRERPSFQRTASAARLLKSEA